MKKKIFALIGTIILFALFSAQNVFAFGFGVHAQYWIPTFKGDLRVDDRGIAGTEISLKDDLGVGNENFPGAEAYFEAGNHEITLAYSQMNLSGAKNLERNIVFRGDTYNVNAYVESDLKTNIIDFEYQYKLINIKNILAGLSVGIIGKIKYLDGEARLHSNTPGSVYDNKENIHVPIPMVGLGVRVGLLANILEARGKVVGMGYSDNFFYDAMADISLTPLPFINLHGGYRAMSIKIDDVSDVYAKMDFYGPYAGLAVSF